MKVIVPDMAHESIDSLFEYLAIYSSRNAIQIIQKIYEYIYDLGDMPYLGKTFAELPDKHFRELLYKKIEMCLELFILFLKRLIQFLLFMFRVVNKILIVY